jgi:hypothetical protein
VKGSEAREGLLINERKRVGKEWEKERADNTQIDPG